MAWPKDMETAVTHTASDLGLAKKSELLTGHVRHAIVGSRC